MPKKDAVQKAGSHEVVYKVNDEEIRLNLGMVRDMLANPTKSGKLPTDKDVVKYIMLCKSQKLNPWEGDCYLLGFDGRNGPEFQMITSFSVLLKRAEGDPNYDGKASGVIVNPVKGGTIQEDRTGSFVPDGETLVGAWCRVYRKDRRLAEEKRIKLSSYNRRRSTWETMPEVMIVKCAEAAALRAAFPNKLGFAYLKEEFNGVKDVGGTVEIKEPVFTETVTPEPEPEPEPVKEEPAKEEPPPAVTEEKQDYDAMLTMAKALEEDLPGGPRNRARKRVGVDAAIGIEEVPESKLAELLSAYEEADSEVPGT